MSQPDDKRECVEVSISLTPELARFVQAPIKAGTYASVSEVVREDVRLLWEQNQLRQVHVQELREKVRVGLDQARRGELVDIDTVIQELDLELDDQERTHGKT